MIEVSGVVLPGNLTIFTMYTNATVFFTTGDTNFQSSPATSTASQSEPASTPNFIQEPFSAMLIIAAVLIVAAIGGILLLQHYKSNRLTRISSSL
ncbi:MAG: hypothetical protein QW674_05870 [Candidatus Bathyarchaeia archaeon]